MDSESNLKNGSLQCDNANNNTKLSQSSVDISTSTSNDEFDIDYVVGRCGCWSFRPSCIQCFATIRKFVLSLAILSVFQGTLAVGYIGSVVTTIQRRYDLPTYLVGFIVSVYDIGCLSAVIFTSYLGGRPTANKPKWITFSSFLMSLGAAVYTIPHFLGPVYEPSYIIVNEMEDLENTCLSSNNIQNLTCESQEISHRGTIAVFILAEFLIGIGSTSVLTLGTIYIDDFAKRSEGSIFISVLYCMGAAGPALGYVFGSLFLKVYVDVGRVDDDDIKVSPDDEQWVGAWWLGFLVCSICIFFTACPIIMYPQKMHKQEELDDDVCKDPSEGRVQMSFQSSSLKELPHAFWRLVSNPIYFFVCMTACAEFSIVSGFVKFVPKFIESQFTIPASTANLLTASLIPAAAIGTVLGAYVIRRFKLGLSGMAKFCLGVIILGFSILAASFLLGGCDSVVLAGITTPYTFSGESSESTEYMEDTNLLDSCNTDCDCSSAQFQPICASAIGITYFSPCHAGCNGLNFESEDGDNVSNNFTRCNCVSKFLKESGESDAGYIYTGKCSNECGMLVPFMFILISLVIVITMGQIPMVMMTLRSVCENDRPFALGVQFLFVRLLAYIPSPTYFGAVIDTACILWEDNCGVTGSCIEYDNHKFFLVYLGLCLSLKTMSIALVFTVWRLSCRRETKVQYLQGLANTEEDEVIYEFKTGESTL
ncbi:solute carrier organic anion transporter family member 5A1-like [Antedon mediterranea]|uniref:solute carrier organic anion transporter family member 5A1-like n=1 Tax=Antedon mediterranea TaxID=105859 RepID=UPI003AF9C4F1